MDPKCLAVPRTLNVVQNEISGKKKIQQNERNHHNDAAIFLICQ